MKKIAIVLLLVFKSIHGEDLKLNQNIIEKPTSQCENLIRIFSDLIGSEKGVRDGILNIAIADYSTKFDTSCLIKNGLLNVNENVVIYGITKGTFEYPGSEPDYLVVLQDYSDMKNLALIGSSYFMNIKSSTSTIVITHFDNVNQFISSKTSNLYPISDFFSTLRYSCSLILNIFNDSVYMQKYTQTLDSHNIEGIDSVSNAWNCRLHIDNIKLSYQEVLPYSFINDDGQISGVDGNLIDEFSSKLHLDYKIVNEFNGGFMNATSNLSFDIEYNRRSTINDLKSYEIVHLYETSPSQCFLVPRNIVVYKAFENPFSNFVTGFLIFTVWLIAVLWKLMKWLQNEDFTTVTLSISMLKIFIGLAIDEERYRTWSMKEKFLLMPFIFMCIILNAVYQSYLISALIVEHPMRSVTSIEQLNTSNTQIYEYLSDPNRFQPGKVVNLDPVSSNKHEKLLLPENFEKELAYAVHCRFAENFVRSKRNWQEKRILFNVLKDPMYIHAYSTFAVAENFPYKDKFKFTIKSLEEAGIINFWTNRLISKQFPKHPNTDNDWSFLGIMIFPFNIFLRGVALGGMVFVIEKINGCFFQVIIGLLFKIKIFKKLLITKVIKSRMINDGKFEVKKKKGLWKSL